LAATSTLSDRTARDHRYNTSAKGRARHRKYNHSAKGLTRDRKYYYSSAGFKAQLRKVHRRRSQRIQERLEELQRDHAGISS
jgi:N-glycosylase/DNA lyase